MRIQHTNQVNSAPPQDDAPAGPEDYVAPAEKKFGAVSVCAGDGFEKLFRELGPTA